MKVTNWSHDTHKTETSQSQGVEKHLKTETPNYLFNWAGNPKQIIAPIISQH